MHLNRKNLAWVFLALVVFFLPVRGAISSADSIDFVSEENHFLEPNDSVEQPVVPILHGTEKFWVIPVISGSEVATFIPVYVSEKKLSDNRAVNEALFSTAQFLRSYILYKSNLASQNKRWFLGPDNSLILSRLSRDLKDELFTLNIVKADFAQGKEQIELMQSQLSEMSDTADQLSDAVFGFVETESEFVSAAGTSDLALIRDSAFNAFDILFELESQASAYQSEVSALKLDISQSNLPADKKNNFINLVDPPPELFTLGSTSIGNWVIASQEARSLILAQYNLAKSKSFLDAAWAEFSSRVARNAAYAEIYGSDEPFREKAGYSSLDAAIRDMALPGNAAQWQNQEKLAQALSDFDKSVRAFENQQFDVAIALAQQSKRAAERVVAAGVIPPKADGFNPEQWINVAIIVLLIVIVLYFVRNRSHIMGAFAKSSGEESVDLDNWKKRV